MQADAGGDSVSPDRYVPFFRFGRCCEGLGFTFQPIGDVLDPPENVVEAVVVPIGSRGFHLLFLCTLK